jgi:bifunctional DNA-binding transcriptional regulator/antitoxin component of YhaV-PrlF toxin-antitoxin module
MALVLNNPIAFDAINGNVRETASPKVRPLAITPAQLSHRTQHDFARPEAPWALTPEQASDILSLRESERQYIRKEIIMQTFTLQIAQRGLITLPQELRKTYNIQPGQQMNLFDLDGVFVLSPRPSQVDAIADRIAEELGRRGETLESMLVALREVRTEHA